MTKLRYTIVPAIVGLLVLAAFSEAVAPVQGADGDRYAAIAYSQTTGRYGYSYGYSSRYDAEQAALRNSKASDARVVTWARNWWCALALGDETSAYGFGYASTAAEARSIALREARKRTTNCYIAVCVHADQ